MADVHRLGVERLDAVIISHADEDHAGGLIDVVSYVPVSAVYDSDYPHTPQPTPICSTYRKLRKRATWKPAPGRG